MGAINGILMGVYAVVFGYLVYITHGMDYISVCLSEQL